MEIGDSDSEQWPDMLAGRKLYHITPLHYLPSILADGAVYAKSVLAAKGVAPRSTARRRDKMLGLQDYVHFSFDLSTPILLDKLNKGFPHAVLVFDAPAVARTPNHALMPYNTKAWRTRAAYQLIADDCEKARLLRRHDSFRELKSLEFLVKYGVGLDCLNSLLFVTSEERDGVKALCDSLSLGFSGKMRVEAGLAPAGYRPVAIQELGEYFNACRQAGSVLTPPPQIPFD